MSKKAAVGLDMTSVNEAVKQLVKQSTAQLIQEMLQEVHQTNEQQLNMFEELSDKQDVLKDKLPVVNSIG